MAEKIRLRIFNELPRSISWCQKLQYLIIIQIVILYFIKFAQKYLTPLYHLRPTIPKPPIHRVQPYGVLIRCQDCLPRFEARELVVDGSRAGQVDGHGLGQGHPWYLGRNPEPVVVVEPVWSPPKLGVLKGWKFSHHWTKTPAKNAWEAKGINNKVWISFDLKANPESIPHTTSSVYSLRLRNSLTHVNLGRFCRVLLIITFHKFGASQAYSFESHPVFKGGCGPMGISGNSYIFLVKLIKV